MTYDLNDLRGRFKKLYEEIAQTCKKVGRNKDDIKVVIVTKTHSIEVLQALIDVGHPDIGENRVQEIVQKVSKVSRIDDNRSLGWRRRRNSAMFSHLTFNR